MSTIKVPVINEAPNTITVTFPSEYSVSFEAANPDGVPGHCQTGGPGILGSPEYVNFLQRNLGIGLSGTGQTGYTGEQFQLAQYPNHTFYSFKNFTTGAKNIVAFNTATPTTAAVPTGLSGGTGAIAGATSGASGATSVAKTFSTPMTDAGAATFTWGGTAIGAITSGQGTTAMKFTVGTATGVKTVTMTVVNELGNTVVTSSNFTVS
jgi:hypothetical protein